MKKIAILTVLFGVACAFEAVALTEDANGYTWTYRINGEEAEIYSDSWRSAILPEPTGVVVMPATLGGKPVTRIGDHAFYNCATVEKVDIPASVTSVAYDAFLSCPSLADESGLVIVRDVVFGYYGESAHIALPEGVRAIGYCAFQDNDIVRSISIPTSLAYIDKGGLQTSTIRTIFIEDIKAWCNIGGPGPGVDGGYAIYLNGALLKDLEIPNGVASIGGAFANVACIESVQIPNSVTSIRNGAFAGCDGMRLIIVSDENPCYKSVNGLLLSKDGKKLVQGVNGDVVIPDSVSQICSSALSGLGGLTSVRIPDGVTSIGSYAFEDCTGLTSITIPSSVTSIGWGAFCGCSGLGNVVIGNGVKSVEGSSFYNCSSLASVTIPASVTNIANMAFCNCDGLTCVTIPGSVTSIGYEAFRNCSGLVVVHVGNDGDVEAVRRMFAASGFDVSGVTFDYVDNPVGELNVVVTNTVTYLGLEGVTNTNVTEFTTNDLPLALGPVEREGHQFVGWSPDDGVIAEGTMSNVTFTANWERKSYVITFETGVELSVQPARRQWHEPMDNLPVLEFPNRQFVGWVTCADGASEVVTASMQVERDVTLYAKWRRSCVVDGREWIYDDVLGCVGICPIHIVGDVAVPEQLDGLPVRNIPEVCFANSSNLVSIAIPASITNIGAYAFYNCVNLKDVVFNEGLISIGDGAFAKCESIEKVTLPSTVGSIGSRLAIVNPVAEVSEKSETHYSFETNYVDDARCARELRSSQDETVCSACNTGRGVFECCLSLKEVELNEGLESIGAGAFKGCKDLAGLVIPDNVSSIGGLAETLMKSTRESSSSAYDLLQEEGGQPSVLTSEHIISDACSSCEHVDSGFLEGCSALCSVKLPKCLKYLGPNSFAGCSRLTFVELPDSLTVINRGTFSRCKKLIRIKFPENLELIGGDELPYSIREASHYDAAWANGKELPLIISDSVIISTNGVVIDSATSQGQKMPDIEREVEDCRWLADPQGVRIQVDEAAFEEWFYRWKGAKVLMDVACPLTDDELNKVRMEFASVRPTEPSFESLDNGVFYGCSSLREVCLPQSVRRIADYSFYDCCNLVKIELPKRLDMLGYQVFGGETALKDIATPWFNFCSLWEIFPSHSYVTNLVILSSPPDLMDPNDVFKAVMKDIRGEAFTLEEANARMIPLSDDERRQVGRKILEDLWITQDEVLYGFWNLKSLTLPEGLRSFDWTIGWWSTQKLLDVTLPNTLAGLGLRALAGFPLEHIAIPSSLQTMEDEVFLESNVDDVLFMGNAPCDVSANVFVDASGWDPDYAAREDLVINVYPGTFGWGGDFESATLPTDGLWPAHAAIYKRRPIQFVRQPVSVALGGEGAADALTYFDAAVNRLVTVPQTWLNSYGLLFVDAVGAADVANLSPIVSRTLYDSYVAGLDPTDEESQFMVKIEIVNNEPVVSWEPELSPEEAAKRKYTIYGCTELGGEWHKVEDVSAESRPQFRFFKVGVEMK